MWQRSPVARLFRWLCSWQGLRWTLIVCASLATLIVLFYTVENWRGKRAWEAHKRQWEARGEKFTIAQLAPPPVPDDQNFALTPLLKPVLDFTRGPSGVVWRDTNGQARLESLKVDLSDTDKRASPARDMFGSLEKGTFADLPAWREFYRENTNYLQPRVTGTAAADILVALGKFDPDIKELRAAAASRPHSRFPVEYDYENAWDILLPHLATVRNIGKLTYVRAVAQLELGQSPKAVEELKLGCRISDSIRDEPILISHLVRIAVMNFNLQTLREGLIRHAWTDAQLAEIEKHLASVDLLAEYKLAMRGERAFSTSSLDWLRRKKFRVDPGYLDDPSAEPGHGASQIRRFIPGGWYYQNMLTMSEMFQEFNLPMVDEKAHRVFPDMAAKYETALVDLGGGRLRPYNLFARRLLPALGGVCKRSARMQTFVDAARVACALERYRLANGKLPETLDVLAPRFIESIPTDVIDGQPLRYRLKSDGGYVLYSIGWNQTDDGGELVWTTSKPPNVDISQGDWVWQMPVR